MLHVCLSVPWVSDAHGSQERVSDPVGPEFQIVVSHYVGAGAEPDPSARASALNFSAISPAPDVLIRIGKGLRIPAIFMFFFPSCFGLFL